jgi:chlorobactene glucosyltransferase
VLIFFIFSAFLVVVFGLSVTYFFWKCPKLEPSQLKDAPLLSILVPARNEANTIETCLRSLFKQDYLNLHIVVVDDASTDQTPVVLERLAKEDSRLTILQGRPLPKGWTGKNNALVHGLSAVKSERILFLDADVVLQPGAVSAALSTMQGYDAAFLTVWPQQEVKTFWEKAVQPVIVAMNIALSTLQRLYMPPFPEALSAWGPFILVKRDAYETIGGHEAIASEIAEDYLLYSNFRKAGFRTVMVDGTAFVRVRMYDSFESIWEGWSKNLFPGLLRSYLLTLLAVTGIFFFTVSPFILLIAGIILLAEGGAWLLFSSLALVLLLGIIGCLMRSHTSLTQPWLAVNPLGGLVFIGTLLNSALRHTLGAGVTWKGRRYP